MTSAIPSLPRLALLLAALLAAGFASAVRADEFVKAWPVSGQPTVRVKAEDANVRVITVASGQVEFRVNYHGYTLDKDLHLDVRNVGNDFELIESEGKHGINVQIGVIRNKRVDIEVRMPRDANLSVQTGDGGVEVASLNGDIDVRTGDGRLKVSQLTGKLDLETHDGGIEADALKGDVRLHTGDGAIEARNVDGKFDVSTGDGSVRIDGRFDDLDIKSGDGSVVARARVGSTMASPWNIRTGDGPVDLSLPKDFKADLEATTGDGHINVDLPVTVQGKFSPSQVRGAMNGGGQTLSIRTGDGSIRLNTL